MLDPNVDTNPWLHRNQFPLRVNCNPNCPEESYLWALMGIPGTSGAPQVVMFAKLTSAHLYRLFGPPPEPALKYRPPSGRDSNWMTGVGKWVPLDEPEPEKPTIQKVVAQMSQADRAEFAKYLGLDKQ